MAADPADRRLTQAERRARSREALLRAAAQGLSRYGYGNLVLARVASDAGYTRGALYHQFDDKEDLTRAVVEWVTETWYEQVWQKAAQEPDPVDALIAVARGHAEFCRQDIARVMLSIRVEFSGRNHPIGQAVIDVAQGIIERVARLITAGRRDKTIPPGPSARLLAGSIVSALEGLVTELRGRAPADVQMAERLTRGMLGLPLSSS